MRYSEMTLAQLMIEEAQIETDLKKLGKDFDSLSGNEYTNVFDDFANTKQMVGEEIYDCYSALGAIAKEKKKFD